MKEDNPKNASVGLLLLDANFRNEIIKTEFESREDALLK
jgi:hypothetical protein